MCPHIKLQFRRKCFICLTAYFLWLFSVNVSHKIKISKLAGGQKMSGSSRPVVGKKGEGTWIHCLLLDKILPFNVLHSCYACLLMVVLPVHIYLFISITYIRLALRLLFTGIWICQYIILVASQSKFAQ